MLWCQAALEAHVLIMTPHDGEYGAASRLFSEPLLATAASGLLDRKSYFVSAVFDNTVRLIRTRPTVPVIASETPTLIGSPHADLTRDDVGLSVLRSGQNVLQAQTRRALARLNTTLV